MKRPLNYSKINFLLSVTGFIGSLGFYFGVLTKVYASDPQKQLIEQLQKENQFLKEQINQSQHSRHD